MKTYNITRDSKLFKTVAFLSECPVFSMFIKENCNESYNTFNDICTFCRHFFYSVLVLFLYLLVGAFLLNFLAIQPILFLMGTETVSGFITVQMFKGLIFGYLGLLAIQTVHFAVAKVLKRKQTEPKEEEVKKEPGLFVQTFQILSQKHNNFCKRLQVKDKE